MNIPYVLVETIPRVGSAKCSNSAVQKWFVLICKTARFGRVRSYHGGILFLAVVINEEGASESEEY